MLLAQVTRLRSVTLAVQSPRRNVSVRVPPHLILAPPRMGLKQDCPPGVSRVAQAVQYFISCGMFLTREFMHRPVSILYLGCTKLCFHRTTRLASLLKRLMHLLDPRGTG